MRTPKMLQATAARRGRLTVMLKFKHDRCRRAAGSASVPELTFGDTVNSRAKAKLLSVLQETQAVLRRPDNDFAWSKWDDAGKAVSDFDSHLAAIEHDDFSRMSDLSLLFAPTGAIQEVAESSGWGAEFLALAARFDKAAAKVSQ
jgi:hypothetical protein